MKMAGSGIDLGCGPDRGAPVTTTADPPASVGHRVVAIGTEVLGGTRLPVLAGPRHGADMVHVSLRRRHGLPGAADELAQVRDLTAGPLVV